MAWIQTIPFEEATGDLRDRYAEAVRRAGRVWNIVRLMSLRPQIVGFFNYINRVADGLGCDPEPFMTAWR